jgi:hypothetical protein
MLQMILGNTISDWSGRAEGDQIGGQPFEEGVKGPIEGEKKMRERGK